MSEEAVSYLSSYGSSFVKQLQFRSTWAFIVSGAQNNQRIVHAESFQNPVTYGKWASPVTIRTLIKLLPENVVECSWEDTIANRRRREFCDMYEGYGDVCRCKLRSFVVFPICSFVSCQFFCCSYVVHLTGGGEAGGGW